ncbi:hypothetical protein HT118_07070 [Escherichia coli]|nr:hypothetical protein [Escherichia coli]
MRIMLTHHTCYGMREGTRSRVRADVDKWALYVISTAGNDRCQDQKLPEQHEEPRGTC